MWSREPTSLLIRVGGEIKGNVHVMVASHHRLLHSHPSADPNVDVILWPMLVPGRSIVPMIHQADACVVQVLLEEVTQTRNRLSRRTVEHGHEAFV